MIDGGALDLDCKQILNKQLIDVMVIGNLEKSTCFYFNFGNTINDIENRHCNIYDVLSK